MDWSYEQCHHRRGDFAVLNFGVSHGQGPKAPHRLALEELVQRLLNDPEGLNALNASRWEEGLKLLPTIGSVVDYLDYK